MELVIKEEATINYGSILNKVSEVVKLLLNKNYFTKIKIEKIPKILAIKSGSRILEKIVM